MSDRLVRALHPASELVVLACVGTELSQKARQLHQLAPSSAAMLGQGLVGGLLLGALQKAEHTRVNLQLECEGPVRGLLVDADTAGGVRGYVRNKAVHFPPEPRFVARPLLGAKGHVSVLRDVDGEFYRGSVGLESGDLSLDLEHYFRQSEQLATTLQIEALADGDEGLGWVGGVLVQRLPDGDEKAVQAVRERLRGGAVERAVRAGHRSAQTLLEALFPGETLDVLRVDDVRYACRCSKERVMRALATLTNLDLVEMIEQDGKAEIDCDFCATHYVVEEGELRDVLDAIDLRDARLEANAPSDDTVH